METPLFRWGILGTAQIARKNWQAIRNSGNGVIAAVGSRELERSRRFIAECQAAAPFAKAPRPAGSYEELIGADDIDGVYIPLPTAVRKEWVLCAAAAGKHVVCEKPCAISTADLADMLAACERNRVQFMDGVMFMHSRRLERARDVLDDGNTVGKIRRVSSAFSFRAPEEFFASNIRAQGGLEPLGCLGDLGWYCIRIALWAANWRLPRQVTGRILSHTEPRPGDAPVPTEFSGELLFEGGLSSGFYCSFVTELQQWVHVSGESGSLAMPDFVLPFHGGDIAYETQQPAFDVKGCDFNMEPNFTRHVVLEPSNSHPNAQETNLFRHFADQARSGSLNPDWPMMAMRTQQVAMACLESARSNGRMVALED